MIVRCGTTAATVLPHRGGLVTHLTVDGRELLYLDESTVDSPTGAVRGGIPLLFPIAGELPGNRLISTGTNMRLSCRRAQEGKPVMDSDLTRRELIKLGAAAAIAASIGSEPAASQSSRAFFTSDELALVDELSELIIPTDGHSPGARTAGVAAYIDARLAEAWDPADRDT